MPEATSSSEQPPRTKDITIPVGPPRVGNTSPAHLAERNEKLVRLYKAGYPLKLLTAEGWLSERQVRNVVSGQARTSEQRQRWYDAHEKNVAKFRTRRQLSSGAYATSRA